MRPAGRSNNQVRPVTLTRNYTKNELCRFW